MNNSKKKERKMRKLLVLVFVLFCVFGIVSTSISGMILAVDYDPAASEYVLEFDGVEQGPITPIGYVSRYNETHVIDLEPMIEIGAKHTVRLKAINEWYDESEFSDPFEFIVKSTTDGQHVIIVRKLPKVPVSLRLRLSE